ncbi:hypothetical protein F4777DRAFT_501648 [Nemania sp. FL0916]|nr:hypothetical protein F4777DRAFT_501648 [Nemania sp. FL0916]
MTDKRPTTPLGAPPSWLRTSQIIPGSNMSTATRNTAQKPPDPPPPSPMSGMAIAVAAAPGTLFSDLDFSSSSEKTDDDEDSDEDDDDDDDEDDDRDSDRDSDEDSYDDEPEMKKDDVSQGTAAEILKAKTDQHRKLRAHSRAQWADHDRARTKSRRADEAAFKAFQFAQRLEREVLEAPNKPVPTAYTVEKLEWLITRIMDRSQAVEDDIYAIRAHRSTSRGYRHAIPRDAHRTLMRGYQRADEFRWDMYVEADKIAIRAKQVRRYAYKEDDNQQVAEAHEEEEEEDNAAASKDNQSKANGDDGDDGVISALDPALALALALAGQRKRKHDSTVTSVKDQDQDEQDVSTMQGKKRVRGQTQEPASGAR